CFRSIVLKVEAKSLIDFQFAASNMYSTMVIPFDLKGKVAIVTGGADGLGFQFALELLKKEAKARRTLGFD
ncbi:hypothetical protein HUJ05_009554, partial [Dendroctonus ponderosae]